MNLVEKGDLSSQSGLEEEYKTLRSEIAENSRVVSTIFIANTTVTASLIGFGLSSEWGPIFLSPFAILVPSMFYLASQLESTTRISQYLRVFLEPQLERQWQNRWYDLRAHGLMPHRRKYILAVTSLYGALGLVCMILAYLYWNPDELWQFRVAVIVIVPLKSIGILSVRRAFSMSLRNSYAEAWIQLNAQQGAEPQSTESPNKPMERTR